jgi:hypothetical protein
VDELHPEPRTEIDEVLTFDLGEQRKQGAAFGDGRGLTFAD